MIPTRVPQQVITNQSLMLTPQMKINLGILSRLNLGMRHVVGTELYGKPCSEIVNYDEMFEY